jgi:hypothetical protein
MTDQTEASRFRARWRAARVRLFRGYAPLFVIIAAFALITTLTPTLAPDRDVVKITEGGGAATTGNTGAGSGAGPATGTATTLPGSSGGAGSSSGSSGGATGSALPASGSTASGAKTTSCPGQALQIPSDPYSPPCISFSGNNGGATSLGVTASTITLSFRIPSDFTSAEQSVSSLSGATYQPTVADYERTMQGLIPYFNAHFQFYGRKLKLVFFNGQGAVTSELEGSGQAQAAADALTVSQQIQAFADLDGFDDVYDEALAQDKVMSLGNAFLAATTYTKYAPYIWSYGPSCTTMVTEVMNFIDNELGTGKAAYAGSEFQDTPRKYAMIAPNLPEYQTCANEAVAIGKAAGVNIVDDLQYDVDASTITTQADNVVAKLAADSDTDVILLTDTVSPVLFTDRAAEQGYTPEWIEAGTLNTDMDGQTYDQSEWSHAFGISILGEQPAAQATLGWAAYTSVNSDTPAPTIVNTLYQALDEVSIGIEMAGPDLTPQSFSNGLHSWTGSQPNNSNLEFGAWKFPAGQYASEQDTWLMYWDPDKTSTQDGSQGAYVVATPRYLVGQFPTGSPPFPSAFPYPVSSGNS